jgi:hypothetical protein
MVGLAIRDNRFCKAVLLFSHQASDFQFKRRSYHPTSLNIQEKTVRT